MVKQMASKMLVVFWSFCLFLERCHVGSNDQLDIQNNKMCEAITRKFIFIHMAFHATSPFYL